MKTINLDVLNRLVSDLNSLVKEHQNLEESEANRLNIVSELAKTLGCISGISLESNALIKDMTIIFTKYCAPMPPSDSIENLNDLLSLTPAKPTKAN